MTDVTFGSLGLSPEILRAVEAKGYLNPSPIQAGVIPIALTTQKDIVGQAQTGSGKTAAFGLPILQLIDPTHYAPQALILTPTRELAIQIATELSSYATHKKADITLLYGGQDMRSEIAALRRGPQIIVGTPGRVHDHLQKGRLDLAGISYFVLDEADEMLNIGFREEIEEILKYAPVEKRVFLFSATMPPFILSIVKNYMRDYETVSIKKQDVGNEHITQTYYEAPRGHKFDVLMRILDINPEFYGIIFCKTKAETDEVASKLSQRGYLAEAIHGDIEQAMREKVLNRFRKREVSVLVATDVAARGIDVSDLTHVVNFELPDNPETYTHRIGRTGRAGKTGCAISIISNADVRRLFFIERMMKVKINRSQLPTGKEMVDMKIALLKKDLGHLLQTPEGQSYMELSKDLLVHHPAEEVVASLLFKFYQDTLKPDHYKDIINTSKERPTNDRTLQDRPQRSNRDDGMIRLFVAKGRLDGFENPGRILSFLANECGLGDLGAGKVDIMTSFSYVDVPEQTARIILSIFKEKNSVRPLVVKAKEKTDTGFRSSGGGDRGGAPRRNDYRGGGQKRNDFKKPYNR